MNRAIERVRGIPDEPFAWYELCKKIQPKNKDALIEFARSNRIMINSGALHEGWLEYSHD